MRTEILQRLLADREAKRAVVLAEIRKTKAAGLLFDWRFWARPQQLPRPGDWTTWLVLAGRGFGKTRCGAEWVRACVCGPTPLSAGTFGTAYPKSPFDQNIL